MKPILDKYSGLKVCVAVSGGKDSMALLHYMHVHAAEFRITLSALNCDHGIRGEASARDSAFVKDWCKEHKIPLLTFVRENGGNAENKDFFTENSARKWRTECYFKAMRPQTLAVGVRWNGADAVATAHHKNDNAETVLFNLSRGSGLAGMRGITDAYRKSADGVKLKLIRPLISCYRAEIDEYIKANKIPYVEDESNFTENYTRNKIRLRVLPALEGAVDGAVENIYRFSRQAAEDEEYFDNLIDERGLIKYSEYGVEISFCAEKVIFTRAALKALCLLKEDIRDYTSEHLQRLFGLQFAENGKKFEFLNITAFKEQEKLVLCDNGLPINGGGCRPFSDYVETNDNFCGELCKIFPTDGIDGTPVISVKTKLLKFDYDRVPCGAVVRFAKTGDRFEKFGGGTKSLGDYFTDKKIPIRLRKRIPLIADGSDILAICGVEISEKIKITAKTEKTYCILCADYGNLCEKE